MSVTTEGPWAAVAPVTENVDFTGGRGELFGRLVRGYLLMVPTLGLYRFWLTTTKRRFYWQNTVIDGDRLEYTGSALQLLIGFLFALGVFLPIYVAFFYLSFQSSDMTVIGYSIAAVLLWFLSGYAIYRGRDFRLSRTLWRGVRFDQKGSAMGYALRRFGWSIVVLMTAGLALPFMAGSLWRYRYENTWYGDRRFSFTGSWKTVAWPFYRVWLVLVLFGGLVAWAVISNTDFAVEPFAEHGGVAIGLGILAMLPIAGLCFLYYRSRETSRMFSAVKLGEAGLTVRVKASSLFVQYLVYGLTLLAALLVLAFLIFVIYSAVNGSFQMTEFSAAAVARAGWAGLALGAGGYLATLSAFTLLGKVFIDCGFWMLVSRGASISNIESLRDVRATGEDKSVLGEGLADALNVGVF